MVLKKNVELKMIQYQCSRKLVILHLVAEVLVPGRILVYPFVPCIYCMNILILVVRYCYFETEVVEYIVQHIFQYFKVYIHYMCVYTPFCYIVPVGIIRTKYVTIRYNSYLMMMDKIKKKILGIYYVTRSYIYIIYRM